MKVGGQESTSLVTTEHLFTALLWGRPACGKTVLASTAPGRKLWIQFDPEGVASIKRRDDVEVLDFSKYNSLKLQDFKQGGIVEKDLAKGLTDEKFDTVVVDSLTNLGQLALYYAVNSGKANSGKFTATIEAPGMTGYGVRTAIMLDFSQMIMRLCQDKRLHLIFICHELEKMDADTQKVTEITLSVTGGAATVLPSRISEVWRVEDTGRERLIYYRNHALYRPMRSRMFLSGDGKQTAFKWDYDQDTGKGDGTIERYYNTWRDAGFSKVAPPSR
jgi:hypothetical protein